jgi:hypothetical protein
MHTATPSTCALPTSSRAPLSACRQRSTIPLRCTPRRRAHAPCSLQWLFATLLADAKFLASFVAENNRRLAHSYDLLTGAWRGAGAPTLAEQALEGLEPHNRLRALGRIQ